MQEHVCRNMYAGTCMQEHVCRNMSSKGIASSLINIRNFVG